MMAIMMAMDGVEVVNCDFCTFGMQTMDNQGHGGLARKRTKVMTNSKYVAEALRHHQCNGKHQHVVLDGGKAKACERYPEAFSELIVRALMREMSDMEAGDNKEEL